VSVPTEEIILRQNQVTGREIVFGKKVKKKLSMSSKKDFMKYKLIIYAL
jgi:hypothetical protein